MDSGKRQKPLPNWPCFTRENDVTWLLWLLRHLFCCSEAELCSRLKVSTVGCFPAMNFFWAKNTSEWISLIPLIPLAIQGFQERLPLSPVSIYCDELQSWCVIHSFIFEGDKPPFQILAYYFCKFSDSKSNSFITFQMSEIYLGLTMEVNFPDFPSPFSEQDSFMPNTPTQGSVLSVTQVLPCKDNVSDLIWFDLYWQQHPGNICKYSAWFLSCRALHPMAEGWKPGTYIS